MNFLEEAFVIIHIRLSGVKVSFIKASNLVTIFLILFLIFSLIELYKVLYIGPFAVVPFIQDIVYLFAVIYISLLWVKSWTKANKHLNGAIDPYQEEKKNDT